MMHKLFSRFNAPFTLMTAFLMLLLTSSTSMGFFTVAGTSYSSIRPTGATKAISAQPQPVKLDAISDAQAIQLAAQSVGTKLSSRMLHRVTVPAVAQPKKAVSYAITTSSSNWGGYYVNSSSIEGSYGCVKDTNDPTYDAASWTGVGGVYGNGDLAQSGVDQYQQEAWIETYPNPPTFYFSTNVNDTICSEVKYVSSGKWYINVTDTTTGTYYANNFSFSPNRSSAEWITEAQPGYSVPNVGSVPFSSTEWFNSSGHEVSATSSGTLYDVELLSPYGGALCPTSETGTTFSNQYSSSGSC